MYRRENQNQTRSKQTCRQIWRQLDIHYCLSPLPSPPTHHFHLFTPGTQPLTERNLLIEAAPLPLKVNNKTTKSTDDQKDFTLLCTLPTTEQPRADTLESNDHYRGGFHPGGARFAKSSYFSEYNRLRLASSLQHVQHSSERISPASHQYWMSNRDT